MGKEIRTFANIDLNNENPLGQCILFLWKIIHAATQLILFIILWKAIKSNKLE